MPSKEDVIAALQQVNQRVERLRHNIIARPDAALLTPGSTWSVRDALCHLAARSDGVPMFVERIERLAAGGPMQPPGAPNIDDINQSQINARQGRSTDELVTEILQGHLAAIEGMARIEAGLFSHMIPNPRGEGEIQASELLQRGTAGHDNVHLDEIEQALSA